MRRRLLYLTFLLPIIFTGCIADNSDECLFIPTVEVRIATPPADDDTYRGPVAPDDVKSIVYYVFGNDGKFLASSDIALNKEVKLDYPNAGPLHIVALANCNRDNETTTVFEIGQMIADGNISLIQLQEYLAHKVYGSPSDLFWGCADVINDRRAHEHVTVDIDRITASVNIKIRGLKEFARTTDENFTVIVSTDFNMVDFGGVPSGTDTHYRPQGGAFSTTSLSSQLEFPSFNMFSSATGENITILIYHNGTLIDTIDSDSEGDPLTAYNGALLEVRIDYLQNSGYVMVTFKNAEWGREPVWKDFA